MPQVNLLTVRSGEAFVPSLLIRGSAVLGLLVLGLAPLSGQVPSAAAPACGATPADSTTESVVRPKYLGGPLPVYPSSLRFTKSKGEVRVRMIVGCNGRVDSATVAVVRSTDSLFTRAAIVAIVRSEFTPATLKGHAVAYRMEQVVRFRINDDR